MKNIWRVIIVIAILCLIFFSKWYDYKNQVDFYKKDINLIIKSIIETRGTKVHYNNDEFFYLETYKGVSLEVGDSISKKNEKIEVYSNGVLTGYGEIMKPKETYFEYFFGF